MWFYLLGLLTWIVLEYSMHRFVLHNKFDQTHFTHHNNPKSIENLFVSPKITGLVSVLFCLSALIFFNPTTVMLLYSGLVSGYLTYEFIHYRIHHIKPKTRFMKYLRKHHLQHHVKEERNFSVIFPPLDKIFGTD